MVRLTCDMETNIISVERVKEYSETETEVCGVSTVLGPFIVQQSPEGVTRIQRYLLLWVWCIDIASSSMTGGVVHRREPTTQQLARRRQGCL